MSLALLLGFVSCDGGSEPSQDAALPDQKVAEPDRAVFDAPPPDLSPWVTCKNVSVERVCASSTGSFCCLGPASTSCPPGFACEETSCVPAPRSPDAGPCAPGAFCRSQRGCACVPSTGGPCPCGGACVTSCTKTEKCSW